MDNELQRALTEFDELIKAWNSGKIATEDNFLHDVKLVNARITLLLPDPRAKDTQRTIC